MDNISKLVVAEYETVINTYLNNLKKENWKNILFYSSSTSYLH